MTTTHMPHPAGVGAEAAPRVGGSAGPGSSAYDASAQAERPEPDPPMGPAGIMGRAPAMLQLFRVLERVAPTRATVLVTGETGTGKELVARALHELSHRGGRHFVPVACSALPDTLLEAELFGFVKGTFTGAVASREGLIERAAGGTLFLDEVSTLSEDMQVKLLRVIQDRRVQRVGGRSLQLVDFRLVAATNTELETLVRQGTFREDLFYRLNVFPIEVPPLRARKEDIPLLARHFARRFAREQGVEPPVLTPALLHDMARYDWPGNVRELEGFMERVVILAETNVPLRFHQLIHPTAASTPGGLLLESASRHRWTLAELEREYILTVLEETGGRKTEAARQLGVSRRTLYRRIREYIQEGYLPPETLSG